MYVSYALEKAATFDQASILNAGVETALLRSRAGFRLRVRDHDERVRQPKRIARRDDSRAAWTPSPDHHLRCAAAEHRRPHAAPGTLTATPNHWHTAGTPRAPRLTSPLRAAGGGEALCQGGGQVPGDALAVRSALDRDHATVLCQGCRVAAWVRLRP